MEVDKSGYNRGRALMVLRDAGPDALKLLADTDRANADMRYRRGDIDFAITCIDRAIAAEHLLVEVAETSY